MKPAHPPTLTESAFDCPHCEAYAAQWKYEVSAYRGSHEHLPGWNIMRCARCSAITIWHGGALIYPRGVRPGIPPLEAMPDDVKAVYDEAREVGALSPRSAVALLRLALQMLVDDLVSGHEAINAKIGTLVSRGLDPNVQKAMDVLRVYGNNAVHPGQIEVDAETDTLPALFALLNMIVDQVIVRAESVRGLYESLPAGARAAIDKRDGRE